MSAAEPPSVARRYVLFPAPVIGLGLWAVRSRGENTFGSVRLQPDLETIPKRDGRVRVPAVLAEEVVARAGNQHAGDRRAPVLPARLRVFALGVDAPASLANRALDGDAAC